jgi:hypothetical protein
VRDKKKNTIYKTVGKPMKTRSEINAARIRKGPALTTTI